jgi:hypothetical protein
MVWLLFVRADQVMLRQVAGFVGQVLAQRSLSG